MYYSYLQYNYVMETIENLLDYFFFFFGYFWIL